MLLSLPMQSLNSRCRAAKYRGRPVSQRIVLTNQLSSILGRGDPQWHPVPGGWEELGLTMMRWSWTFVSRERVQMVSVMWWATDEKMMTTEDICHKEFWGLIARYNSLCNWSQLEDSSSSSLFTTSSGALSTDYFPSRIRNWSIYTDKLTCDPWVTRRRLYLPGSIPIFLLGPSFPHEALSLRLFPPGAAKAISLPWGALFVNWTPWRMVTRAHPVPAMVCLQVVAELHLQVSLLCVKPLLVYFACSLPPHRIGFVVPPRDKVLIG